MILNSIVVRVIRARAFRPPPSRQHSHCCRRCKTVWAHSDAMVGNDDAHRCPRCGRSEWMRYYR